jgi:hypothetical protein
MRAGRTDEQKRALSAGLIAAVGKATGESLNRVIVIVRRGTDHGSGLGAYRWVVEQTFTLRPAALVPPITHPLGDPRRHPRSLPASEMLDHPLPPNGQLRTL